MFGHHAYGYDAKDECARKPDHEGRGNHGAAMSLIFTAFSRRQLYIALFAMHMRLRLEYSSKSLHKRLGRIRRGRRRAGRGIMDVGV
jgi:hypothetical protein